MKPYVRPLNEEVQLWYQALLEESKEAAEDMADEVTMMVKEAGDREFDRELERLAEFVRKS